LWDALATPLSTEKKWRRIEQPQDFSEFGEIKQPVIFDLPQRTVIGSLAPTMPHKKFSLQRGNIF
jgi:hypothetical protein